MFAACLLAALPALAQPALRYLGYQTLPTTQYQGTRIGGLSGIDFDPVSDTYYAISDERTVDARYLTLRLDLAKFTRDGLGDGVRITGAYRLRDLDGRAFAPRSVDAESIRVDHRRARLYWANEGNPGVAAPPSVREMTLAGEPVRALQLPAKYVPRGARGVRSNLAFESLTLTPDDSRVIAATESALRQDGAPATLGAGSPCRVPVWDRASGRLLSEYVYLIDPVAKPALLPGGVAMNGLSELLALDVRRMIALERSYSVGAGFTVRLYLTSFAGATDVSTLDALAGAPFTPMGKQLLLDLSSPMNDRSAPPGAREAALPIDNYEGIALGPRLPSGHRSLVLVSDDNFSGMQRTLFLAFELIDDEPDRAQSVPPIAVKHGPARRGPTPARTDMPAMQ